MRKRKNEMFQRLKMLFAGLCIMLLAIVLANGFTAIASAAGLLPKVTANGPQDDGVNLVYNPADPSNPTKEKIPGATTGNGIDDSTEQMAYFFTMLTNFIVGIGIAICSVLLAVFGFKYTMEHDPQKKD